MQKDWGMWGDRKTEKERQTESIFGGGGHEEKSDRRKWFILFHSGGWESENSHTDFSENCATWRILVNVVASNIH